ncbi:MAG: SRPBCC domain-containing protein [Catenulispora sp.]|nr:SRPBCC domain-containing protein [Catenulispora sp.]
MSEFRIVHEYAYPIDEVWRVMTDPELVARWTTTGQGGRPEGFAPVVGTQFRYIGKPTVGWAGIVYCTVLSVDAPHSMSYTWAGEENGPVTTVAYTLEPTAAGTRFTWHHTGFTGLGGLAMAKLLARVRRKMLAEGVPHVLKERSLKERSLKERSVQERSVQERSVQERSLKERSVQERSLQE